MEKKSRFIATCRPLSSEQEALAFIGSERCEFPDASHHVYAWIVAGDYMLQRFSDDGEPSGTGGMPVLETLRRQGIDQAGIVVSRYFGGVLLGTGGLSRAYALAAARSVAAAGPVDLRLCQVYRVTTAYTDMERLRRAWQQKGWLIESLTYGIDVEALVAVPVDAVSGFAQQCADLSQGSALLQPEAQQYRPLPPPDPPA
jgi:uncharacterized YigZ family protein